MATSSIPAPDLTIRPPRSPRVRLGGYVLLPRLLDKCRATIAGKNGEYHYDCPLDKRFFNYVGIDAGQLQAEVAKGISDTEALAWITENAKNKQEPWEIQAWSCYQEKRAPDSDPETIGFFHGLVAKFSMKREDILTWADLLDLDDHCSFGGPA